MSVPVVALVLIYRVRSKTWRNGCSVCVRARVRADVHTTAVCTNMQSVTDVYYEKYSLRVFCSE
jgi:hypothetical protein